MVREDWDRPANCPQVAYSEAWGGLLQRLPPSLTEDALIGAWRRSRDSTPSKVGAAGVDSVSAQQFSSQLHEHIRSIGAEVRSGNFGFSKLRMAPVPKENGGDRIIAIPTVRDRLVQRAVLFHLEKSKRFEAGSEISYGFMKGRSLIQAQKQALALRHQRPWVLKVDIVKFFDEIPRQKLKMLVKPRVRSRVIARLIEQAIDCELDETSPQLRKIAADNGIVNGRGLRQGMPLSPMLSNLVLRRFDQRLITRGMAAVRYADDIALFFNSRQECIAAVDFINGSLSETGLRVPALSEGGKTVICEPSEIAEFLGLELKLFGSEYRLNPPTRKLVKIEIRMAEIATLRNCLNDKKNIGQVVRTLDAFVAGHRAALQGLEHGDDFIARLQWLKKKALEGLLVELFGAKAVETLDQGKLAILGIGEFPKQQSGRPASNSQRRRAP